MDERRRRQRLPWVSMEAQVKIRKGMLSSEWVSVKVVDFSRLGIGIRTESDLGSESRVQLSLVLKTEVGDIAVDKVGGTIRHSHLEENGRFVGIEFEEKPKATVSEGLQRIEGILERYQKLASRFD